MGFGPIPGTHEIKMTWEWCSRINVLYLFSMSCAPWFYRCLSISISHRTVRIRIRLCNIILALFYIKRSRLVLGMSIWCRWDVQQNLFLVEMLGGSLFLFWAFVCLCCFAASCWLTTFRLVLLFSLHWFVSSCFVFLSNLVEVLCTRACLQYFGPPWPPSHPTDSPA